MGIDWLSGGAFYADPIGWTLRSLPGVTNPNVIVFGAPGRGKSGTVKMFCLRMMAYGYRTLILGDVKDEYEPLCRAVGVQPHAVGHGLPARINPLDFGPLGHDWARLPREEAISRAAMVFARWLLLIRGLVGSQQVPFGPTAETAVRLGDARPHRLPHRRDRAGRDHHPAAVARPGQPQPGAGAATAATPAGSTSSTKPGRSATRSAPWSQGTWPACSTPPPPFTSTGTPRSSRCPCPGSTRSATRRSAWR